MRKTSYLVSMLLAGVAGSAAAADKVTVQLKWLPQAQFAGYYVAQAKGFYKEADLDVTIKPGGPDIAPAQVLAAKGADLTVDWMPSALAAREAGVPMVNVAQIFNRSGMMLTCKKSSGVPSRDKIANPGRSVTGNCRSISSAPNWLASTRIRRLWLSARCSLGCFKAPDTSSQRRHSGATSQTTGVRPFS